MGVIYEKSFWAFFFVTVLLGGGAAFMIGRATASRWKPFAQAVIFVAMLGAAVRFLHWGLFLDATLPDWRAAQGTLLSLHYYLADTIILLLFAALGFRLRRLRQMLLQYGWLYERTGLLGWRLRRNS